MWCFLLCVDGWRPTSSASVCVVVLDVVDAMQILMESNVVGQRYVLSAENIYYRDIFNAIANAFNKKQPHKKVTPFLAGIVWRLEAIKFLKCIYLL